MITQQRREREVVEMRRNILQAARDIAAAEGWVNVTIRKIAEMIEYSAPLIYKYFDSKEAILDALIDEGYGILTAAVANAPQPNDTPRQALLRTGPTICDFAWQHPELYRVMNGLDGVPCRLSEPVENSEMFQLVRRRLQAAADTAGVEIVDMDAAVYLLWGGTHGLIAILLSNEMTGGPAMADKLVTQMGETLLIGMGISET